MPNEEQTSNKIAKLIQQLNSKRIADVNRAVEDLGNFKSPKAQNKLFEIITNTPSSKKWDYQIRVRAIKSLSRKNLDKRLKEELVNIIEKPQLNKELRREALTQIANIGDSKYIDILKNNLKDPYMFIRMWAVRGLLKINNPQLGLSTWGFCSG